ncbi:MAG TPA: transglycosylase domain-containing protein [Thermoanaerobaculia bacterium]|nr:transglycosylase domain-containing protein [Thermoanaerobaculia bacterium]
MSERLGLDVRVGALRFEDGGVSLRDLRLGGDRRGVVDIERLDLQVNPLRLARGTPGAIRNIRLAGVTAEIPLDAPAAALPEHPERPERASGGDSAAATRYAAAIAGLSSLVRRSIDLLAEDATVELERGLVRGVRSGARSDLVRGLSAHWRHGSGGVVTGHGRGEVAGGGLEWTATLAPGHGPDSLGFEAEASLEHVPFGAFLPLLPSLPWHRPEQTTVSGRMVLARGPEDGQLLRFEGDLAVRELGLDSPRLAEAPVIADVSIAGRGSWSADGRRLEVSDARFGLGAAELEVSGSFQPADQARRLELLVTLPPTPCNQVIDGVPPSVLGELAAFEWTGTLAGSLVLELDERALSEARLELAVADRCRFVRWPERVGLERFAGPFAQPVELAPGVVGTMISGPGTPAWTPLEEVSSPFVWAVLAHEDAAFFRHRGFAPWAIETALQRNLVEGRFVLGASTISMQLAKNLFLARDKTLARKLREAILTWWLEERLDKRRILELYVNVIEYGPSVFGIRQAAAHYFGRQPDELSIAEAVFLANLLPAPGRYHREYEAGVVRDRTRYELQVLLAAMARRDWIAPTAREQAEYEIETLGFYRGARPGELLPRRAVDVRAASLPLPGGAPRRLDADRRTIDWSWLVRRPPPG